MATARPLFSRTVPLVRSERTPAFSQKFAYRKRTLIAVYEAGIAGPPPLSLVTYATAPVSFASFYPFLIVSSSRNLCEFFTLITAPHVA